MSLTFIDLFAGVGGFRLGMEQAGHKCLGYVEIDKFARKSYEAIHNTEGEWTAHDITTVTNDDLRLLRGTIDVICGGFPCQAFSIAGKRLGFAETRGTLFFEIARFAKEIQPQYLFLENVKGLLNHEGGNTFRTILSTLDELGYDAEWQVLNSKDFGVPQNRERVFIVGHSRRHSRREVFPVRRSCETPSIEIIGTVAPETAKGTNSRQWVHSVDGIVGALGAGDYKQPKQVLVKGMLDIKGKDQIRRVYGTEGISPCLTTMQGGGKEPKILDDQGRRNKEHKLHSICPTLRAQTHGNEPKVVYVKEATKRGYTEAQIGDSINFSVPNSKTRRGRVGKGIAQTLDTACNQATIENKPPYRIRKLTPRECWRLQGFPDWAFDKAREVNSDSQLYKQAGNSVTVPVIYEIAKRLV